MKRYSILFCLFIFQYCFLTFANETKLQSENIKKINLSTHRKPEYLYKYVNKKHTINEKLAHIAALYGVSWAVYPLTQPSVFKESGSWKNYENNLGKIVFDHDEPFWNWMIHPISGSQLFLFYRANGYNRTQALTMSFISSTLFELTVEVYTEPASLQDLYQTPIFGAILGVAIENLSLYLLNTGNIFGKLMGHIINPSTLFWFYEGKIKIIPVFDGKSSGNITLMMDF